MRKYVRRPFENAENLGGKAWQHAIALDLLEQVVVMTVFKLPTDCCKNYWILC